MPVAAPPALHAFNLYRKPLSHLSSRQAPDPREPSNQSPDNQSSTAEINQQIVGPELPRNGAQQQTLTQFTQGGQFTTGQGFNFGSQPGQLNFGFGTPRINHNISPQPAGTIEQGTNAFQQNFPPFNFRTGTQLSSQFNVGQSGNPLPISSAQQNIPQYIGTNVNTLPGGLPQQAQDLGQFNSFQFTSPNLGQGFAQQFTYPSFAPAGQYTTTNQTSILAASEGDQGSVVGFYGGVPNAQGYSFNGAPLQGQTQNLIPNTGGLIGSNFGQYVNGAPPLDTGASQLGTTGTQLPNAFSQFSFNPPAFQSAGVVQETSFSRRVGDEKAPPVVGQPGL
jgi:hypothetical protein